MSDQIITDEQDDMALKLSIEAGLIVPVKRLFRQIAIDYQTVYTATGSVLNASVYNSELIGVLRPAYRKGANKAGVEIRNEVDIVSPDKEEIDNRINLNLINFTEREPENRAVIINNTTTRQLNAFTLGAIITAALAGIFPSAADVAREVSKIFLRRSAGRSQNIAVTETLNAVEGARLIEANTLLEANAEIKPKKKEEPKQSLRDSLLRIWRTREDDKVRPTHFLANGQVVKGTITPFVVGNSLLMYPGDTSLGADISEIAGCRCFVENIIRWLDGA
jgi:hypothetical protein